MSSQLAHEQRWERFVDQLHDDPDHAELLYRAVLLDVALTPRYKGQASFKDVASNFSQNWDRIVGLADEPLPPLRAIDFSAFDAAVGELVEACAFCTNHDDKLYQHLQGGLLGEMLALVGIDDPHRKLRGITGRSKWGPGSGGAKGNWSVPPTEVKDLVKAVAAAADDVIARASNDVIDQLMRLTAREVVAAAQARQADGGLEFHDLLVLARSVLRRSPEVRASLHRRYRHVLLDEFQDTDPIQIELASLIAATPADEQASDWREHPIDGGRLFFVGDPKQSIYRFRRADIELFLDARGVFGGDVPVRLRTNFRTVAPIIDWVNGVFDEAMPEEVPGAQPKYEPLVAHRAADSGADHRPVILGGPHPDPKVKAGALREAEANDVAATIAAIRNDPDAWPVFDTDDDAPDPYPAPRTRVWRPARLSDITILIPTRTSLPYLRDALERFGIPYRLATGTLVYDTQEVRDALATLRAIDDPNDTLSLVAALRSPLFGCADTDLFTYYQAVKRWDLRTKVHADLDPSHPVVAALGFLRELWSERWWLGPAALLDRVLRERRAFLLGFGDPRPAEVWRRLRFLLDQARAYEEANGVDLRGFLDWSELQSADGARVHEPLLPETDDDAVDILTVHGAKGLEFSITILSGMTTKPAGRRQGVSVLWSGDELPAVRLKSNLETIEHRPRADLEEEMGDYEKLRLLYVAATRAKDHLIVSGHHKADPKDPNATFAGRLSAFSEANEHLARTVELPALPDADPASSAPTLVPDPDAVAAERARWLSEREAVIAPASVTTAVSATAIARSVDATIADADADDGSTEPSPDPGRGEARPIVRRKGRAGSAIGRAVHATLEHIDFGIDANDEPADLDAQIARQCDLESIPDHIDTVAALVRSAFASPAVDLARRHPAHRELYVAAPLGDGVGGLTVEGYVDLLIEGPDGLVIVDYKTDTVRSEAEVAAKAAGYELQGAAYAVALEISTGMRVADCRFVFCHAAGAKEYAVPDLEAAKARVRATVAGGDVQ
ncbi:MAG: UvrD-helicase domain-containing protein [Acidimicrobiales bacterium]